MTTPTTQLPLSRREFTQLALLVPWLAPLQRRRVQTTQDGKPQMVDPPGPLAADVQKRVDEIGAALASGKTTCAEVLADPGSNELRPYPAFRAAIAKHAPVGRAVLVPRDEPGTRLAVTLRVVRRDGTPYPAARVYAYQTNAKGWYAAEAPHVSGNSGDYRYARLFTHGVTDAEGRLELQTIHPVGYPRTDLPSHIHLQLEGENGAERITEVRFEDCPRMTPTIRADSLRAGFVVVPVEALPGGGARCTAEFALPG